MQITLGLNFSFEKPAARWFAAEVCRISAANCEIQSGCRNSRGEYLFEDELGEKGIYISGQSGFLTFHRALKVPYRTIYGCELLYESTLPRSIVL